MKKLTKFISTNKQLLGGLVIGALIMLPTGLYISERASNNQRIETPDTTTQTPTRSTR